MFKIKDNIDLTELEKFGYIEVDDSFYKDIFIEGLPEGSTINTIFILKYPQRGFAQREIVNIGTTIIAGKQIKLDWDSTDIQDLIEASLVERLDKEATYVRTRSN